MRVLKTWREIDDNATEMANCTAESYGPPGEYGSILCRLDNGTEVINAGIHRSAGSRWVVREINTRFNTGVVPDGLELAFSAVIDAAARSSKRTRQPVVCDECGIQRPATGRVCIDCRSEQWHTQVRLPAAEL